MKNTYVLIVAVILSASASAQSPEKMSYQAVVRDANDDLISSQAVGMQISILQGSAGGAAVYTETQNPATNANGLISIEIGAGTTSDDFSAIELGKRTIFYKNRNRSGRRDELFHYRHKPDNECALCTTCQISRKYNRRNFRNRPSIWEVGSRRYYSKRYSRLEQQTIC